MIKNSKFGYCMIIIGQAYFILFSSKISVNQSDDLDIRTEGQSQGHSTSIEHVGNSTAMTDAGSYYGMGGNAGYSIHALSAIQSNSLVSEGGGGAMQSVTGSEVNSEVMMSSGHMVSEGTQTGSHLVSGIFGIHLI